MRIGLVVAIEMEVVYNYYKEYTKLESPKGFTVLYAKHGGNDVYIINTGMGEIASASGTQYLITKYNVELIANFGVVGGLTHEMKTTKVCVIDKVVHYRYDCSEFLELSVGQVEYHDSIFLPTSRELVKHALMVDPNLKLATIASGDKFVSKESDKTRISKEFESDVCDMESAGIVLTCEANNIPCIMLKAVADGLNGGAREFFVELLEASQKCFDLMAKVISSL